MNEVFRKIAHWASELAGTSKAFVLAIVVIVIWAVSGPKFGFSDTWQLIINTGTTILTFLMVFLVQNTQNRDNKAVQLKLDELLRVIHGRGQLVNLENMSDDEIEGLQKEFEKYHEKYHAKEKGMK